MKRLKKGPEINLSKLKSGDLKAPAALADLYKELKSQHLLPIVVLLVIGLIAVPVLIGRSSDHAKSGAIAKRAPANPSSKQASLKVTKWTPGLLDYKKTLRGVHPHNPFVPEVVVVDGGPEPETGEAEAAAPPSEVEGGAGGGSGAESPAPEPGSAPEEQPHSPSGEGQEKGGGEESSKDESGAITVDVQVTTVHEDGGVDRAPVRHELRSRTKLPSEATPALTYVGPSEDGEEAMMAVSQEVTAMIGDSKCVVHANPCSLLALRVGAPETLVYGPRALTYRIELLRIGAVNNNDAVGKDGATVPGPGSGKGTGKEPAPREANALIGVGSGHVAQASSWTYWDN